MPINAINSYSSVQKMPLKSVNNSAPSFSGNPQEAKNDKIKKALPYVAGAVVLAGLGVVVSKYAKNNKTTKKLVDEGKDKLNKAKEEIKSEVKSEANKAAGAAEKAAPEVKKEVFATDIKAVKEMNEKFKKSAYKIIDEENTHNGFIDVPAIEKVATDFSKDVNRENKLSQSADLLERTYEKAYIHKNGEEKEGFDNLFKRITQESSTLLDIYKQMPAEHVEQRLAAWKEFLGGKDIKCKGMNINDFFSKISEALKK